MTKPTALPAPLDALGPAGAEMVRGILDDLAAGGLEPDARELELLRTAGELRDRMHALEEAIAADGLRSISPTGVVRLHPGAGELRQHAAVMGRLLAGIGMVDTSGKSARHQRAASVRWAREA